MPVDKWGHLPLAGDEATRGTKVQTPQAALRVGGQMLSATAVAVLVAVVGLTAIARVDWPAYN